MGAFDEFAGLYRRYAKKQAGRTCLFFSNQAGFRRHSLLENQSAGIDSILADPSACFFFYQRTHHGKQSSGLGVNKRNLGYPSDFFTVKKFCERTIIVYVQYRGRIPFRRSLTASSIKISIFTIRNYFEQVKCVDSNYLPLSMSKTTRT